MSFDLPEAPQVREVTDQQLYSTFYNELREAMNESLWGHPDMLYRTIAKWQKNLSILPEKDREVFLKKIGRDMGVE